MGIERHLCGSLHVRTVPHADLLYSTILRFWLFVSMVQRCNLHVTPAGYRQGRLGRRDCLTNP